MDLYFQEHDVRPNEPSAQPSAFSGLDPSAMLRLAALISRLAELEGPERERMSAQVQAFLSEVSQFDPSVPGKPPASAESIRTLPVINVRPGPDGPVSCPICTEEFEFNEPAKQLPCEHRFHADCVVPWLRSHCTCPMCREELPTDDAGYEQEKRLEKRRAAASQMQNHMFN